MGAVADARAPAAGLWARYWPDLPVHDSLAFPNTPASEHPYAKDRDAPDRQPHDGDRKSARGAAHHPPGDYDGHTAGVAPEFVQGNLCILPSEMALEFAAFCQRNPKPCPLIGMGAPGDPSLPDLGDIDIRTDVPRYRVFKDGKLVDEPTDIRKYWSR